jgi:hypothetical protein
MKSLSIASLPLFVAMCLFAVGGFASTLMAKEPDKDTAVGIAAKTPQEFTGEKTLWHGFERFDFLMDDTALTVKPLKAFAEEGTGVTRHLEGQLRCIVVIPKETAQGKPWSWRGRYFDHEPQAEIELLKRGSLGCLVYVSHQKARGFPEARFCRYERRRS